MTDKYLCIHGHFYQPPRENPWLEFVEYQASAQPYHDWNERITRECYGPNTRARLHDQEGHIKKLLNNYERMSFNFGPTLLSWLEKAHPWIYDQILLADRASRDRYQGHGNSLAQVYNHIIMPLARRRDKLTQIRWGLADFEQRFGRQAEGMWLAETAVDIETLDMMAQEGIKFTILSPTQAQSVRPLSGNSGENEWQDVSGGQIDPTFPYRVWLDKGSQRFIDIFFYDGPLSRAVAYEKILASGKNFLSRIEQAFGEHKDGPRLVNVATDGESYGHHFKFGDLALSWICDHLEETDLIKLTNYALFLERFPPQNEVKILENSSWSCAHGVERWRSDCGCSVGHTPEWNQAWRAPLREGLDWLNNELKTVFEEQGGRLLKDPWEARDGYLKVFSNPSERERERFLKRHATHRLGANEKVEILQLVESQRMSLYMFTSCGWFFDDISGLEATQVLKYAARAIQLAQPLAKRDLEEGLMGFLSKAISNDPEYGDGGSVYHRRVKPSWIDPSRATAHYALAVLADVPPNETCIFSEMVHPVQKQDLVVEGQNAILGEVQVEEKTTGRVSTRAYVAFRQGTREMSCSVGEKAARFDLKQMIKELQPGLATTSSEKIEEVFLRHLRQVKRYALLDLIPDTRKCLVRGLARALHQEIKNSLIDHHKSFQEFMVFLEKAGEPIPENLEQDFRLLIHDQLCGFMIPDPEKDPVDWKGLHQVAKQAEQLKLKLNGPELRKKARVFLRNQMTRLASSPDQNTIKNMIDFLNMSEAMNLEVDLWECQNTFHDLYNNLEFTKSLDPEQASPIDELGRRLGFLLERKQIP
jgi:alpha-amylase/alpha-mannosidase (GH57 family)